MHMTNFVIRLIRVLFEDISLILAVFSRISLNFKNQNEKAQKREQDLNILEGKSVLLTKKRRDMKQPNSSAINLFNQASR